MTIFSWKHFHFFNDCFFQERFLIIMPSLTYATILLVIMRDTHHTYLGDTHHHIFCLQLQKY